MFENLQRNFQSKNIVRRVDSIESFKIENAFIRIIANSQLL